MIIDPFLNNPKTLYYKKFIMSNLQNTEILERLYEEAYEEIKENNHLGFDEDGIIFAAQCLAQQKFEELPEPTGNYDD